MKKVLLFLLLVALISVGSVVMAAPAAPWKPDHEIRLIVTFAPGGSTDVVGRIVAEFMSKNLGVPVIVDNVPGAGGIIGFTELFTQPNDGYTLAISSSSASPWAIEALSPETPPWKGDDFVSLGTATSLSTVAGFVCKKDRWPDFMSFIADVKANPGKIKFGYQGPGQPNDARIWELEKVAGLSFNIVYYADSASIQTDLLTGDLDVGLVFANRADFVTNKNFSILALFGKESPEGYPVQGIPFLADFADQLGFKWEDTKFVSRNNLTQDVIIQSNADPAIIARLQESVAEIHKDPAYKEAILTTGWPLYLSGPDSTADYKAERDALLEFVNSPEYEIFINRGN